MNAILRTVLTLSVGGTGLAALLLSFRLLLKKRLPRSFYYYAWLLVLLRFILPLPGLLPGPAGESAPTPQPHISSGADGISVLAEEQGYLPNSSSAESPLSFDQGEILPAPETGGAPELSDAPQQGISAAGAQKPDKPVIGVSEARPFNAKALLRSESLWLCVWLFGAFLCLGWYALGYARFSRAVRKDLLPPSDSDKQVFSRLAGDLPPLTLGRCTGLESPMLIGLFRPMLVLPDREYSEEMLRNILLHELTHYKRRDILYKWFAVIVFSLHWFNPFTRLIRRELDRACEISCDDRLLRRMNTAGKQNYGDTLLAMAVGQALPARIVATTFSTEKRNLRERLEHIMTYKKKGPAVLAIVLAMLLLLCGCGAALGPQAESPAPVSPVVTPEPPGRPAAPAAVPEVSEDGYIHVSTVDQFLAAIAPGASIYFEDGAYNLSEAANYGGDGDEYYSWHMVTDGYALVIDQADGLSLKGAAPDNVTLLAEPRSANVLSFTKSSDISISGLTIGHTEKSPQSQCAGAVLNFDFCKNTLIDNCVLFGCGTLGVKTYYCEKLLTQNSIIKECSEGAADILLSKGVQFDNCGIFDCNAYYGLFNFSASSVSAVTNCRIYGNYGDLLFFAQGVTGVSMLGCEIEDNDLDAGMFFLSSTPITVAGCSFASNTFKDWYADINSTSSVPAVSLDGKELTEEALKTMSLEYCSGWEPAKAPESDLSGGEIHVSTVDEFLAAIAPDTTIYLEEGTYDLSTASDYGSYGNEYYTWVNDFDGPGLWITDVDDLKIIGPGADSATILAKPRTASVLFFDGCSNISLEGFTAGHTEEPSICSGGVLRFQDCETVSVKACGLFGCGVRGVSASGSSGISVDSCEIYDCSENAGDFFECSNVAITNCDIHDNGSDSFTVSHCKNITWDEQKLA